MATMIDYNSMLDLTKELMGKNPDNLKDSENLLHHVEGSYEIARETVAMACSKIFNLDKKLNEKEVALAGGLHDIGRILRKNQLFHELRGAKYIEQKGLEKGIADNLIDVYRIAQMIRSHFVVSEQFNDEKNKQEKVEFESLDSRLLIPRTWQEAIIVYAELSNLNGKRISVQDRIDEIKHRYTNNSLYNNDASILLGMQKGLSRVLETCEKVQKLRDGKLRDVEIARYGFL